MSKMKKLISMALALVMAATSFVGFSASAASSTTLKFANGEKVYVLDKDVMSGTETIAFDANLSSEVVAMKIGNNINGDANIKYEGGQLVVSASAPAGDTKIVGLNSAKPDEAEEITTVATVKIVTSEDLQEILTIANGLLGSTAYDEDAMDYFATTLEKMANSTVVLFDWSDVDGLEYLGVDNADATQATIDSFETKIETAINTLRKNLDSTLDPLATAIEEINNLHANRLNYKGDAWVDFIDAIEDYVANDGDDYLEFDQTIADKYDILAEDAPALTLAIDRNVLNPISREVKAVVEDLEEIVSELAKAANRVSYVGDLKAAILTINELSSSALEDAEDDAGYTLEDAIDASNGYLASGGKYQHIKVVNKIPQTVLPADIEAAYAILAEIVEFADGSSAPTAADLADLDKAIDLVNSQVDDKAKYDLSSWSDFVDAVEDLIDDEIIEEAEDSDELIKRIKKMSNDVTKKAVVDLTEDLEDVVADLQKATALIEEYIEYVNSREKSNYTTNSWKNFVEDINKAISYNAETFTDDSELGAIELADTLNSYSVDLDAALADLMDAVARLRSVDAYEGYLDWDAVESAIIYLNSAIDKAARYSTESFDDFAEAVAKEVVYGVIAVDNDGYVELASSLTSAMTQDEIDDYAAKLEGLTSILVGKAGTIDEVIDEVNDALANEVAYTKASFDVFANYVNTLAKNSSVIEMVNGKVVLKNTTFIGEDAIKAVKENLVKAIEELVKVSGWVKNDTTGKWNYVKDGVALTGWVKDVDGKWYFMDDNGDMLTGWVSVGGKWYFLTGSGAMAYGWVYSAGKWYLMDNTGAMVTGWGYAGGKWYFMDASGAMKANSWMQSGADWYYLNSTGAASMATWQWIGGSCYYFYSNCKMAASTSVDGYTLGANGAWVR